MNQVWMSVQNFATPRGVILSRVTKNYCFLNHTNELKNKIFDGVFHPDIQN